MQSCAMYPAGVPLIFVAFFIAFAIVVCLAAILIKTWINCMIFHKAGYSWAWGLLTLVPIVDIILPFFLALGDWPIRKELRRLKDAAKTQAF